MENKKLLIIGGAVLGVAGVAYLLLRKWSHGYASVADAIEATVNQQVMKSYFTINELCASATATAQHIDNTPTPEIRQNLQTLIDNMLNPIRERYGNPIKVTSGYRCPALNTYIKGSSTSQHMTGEAADLVPTGGRNDLGAIFRAAIEVGGYDQLILEKPNTKSTGWVHVSFSTHQRRGQILYYDGQSYNGTKYPSIASNWQQYV